MKMTLFCKKNVNSTFQYHNIVFKYYMRYKDFSYPMSATKALWYNESHGKNSYYSYS